MYALGVTRDDAAMAEHSVPADCAANGDMPESERARLAAAWAAAHYFVTLGRKEWLFCTGLTAPEIERQVMADRYLFITAWNPPPGETPRADNDAAQARLEARVQALGLSLHPALGCDNRGGMVEELHDLAARLRDCGEPGEQGLCQVAPFIEHRERQILLGLEIIIDMALLHAGGVRDVIERHGLVTTLVEQRLRHLDELCASRNRRRHREIQVLLVNQHNT